jgi:hypothetical protein
MENSPSALRFVANRQGIRHLLVGLLVLVSRSFACAQEAAPSGYVNYESQRTEVIVFVHGVTGDARGTWTNGSTNAYWPQLVRTDVRFKEANVWTFSYASPRIDNAQNVEELARKLGDEMRAQKVFESHAKVYFVSHSMGGLIVREMLTQVMPSPSKVPLVYFFGTPSAGADLAGIAAALSENPQFANLRPFAREADVASFSRRWLATSEVAGLQYPQRLWSFCAYEIEGLVANRVIVNQLSASYLCNTAPRASLANHVTMVKPKDTMAEPYQYFASAYAFVRSEAAQIVASSGRLSLYSADQAVVDVASLQVRYATVDTSKFAVDCEQVRAGEVPIAVPLKPSEKLVAATTRVTDASGLRSGKFDTLLDAGGSLNLKYSVEGKRRHPLFGCQASGKAKVDVRYVVEGR